MPLILEMGFLLLKRMNRGNNSKLLRKRYLKEFDDDSA